MAFTVARADAKDPNAPRPPRVLQPMLGFANLPDRALARVREALDESEAFRLRVVERVDTDALAEAGRLFLERPEGWREPLTLLVEESVAEAEQHSLREEVRDLREQLSEALASLEDESAARRALADEVSRLTELQRRDGEAARSARETIVELEARLGEREEAYARSVQQLGEARDLADRRLVRLRELEASIEDSTANRSSGTPSERASEERALEPQRERLGSVFERAEGLASGLGSALEDLRRELDLPGGGAGAPRGETPRAGGEEPSDGRRGPAGRRRAPRPGRGLLLDSPEGLSEMLGDGELLVLVDGYNVSMKGWPGQRIVDQRRSLLAMLGALGANGRAEVRVVFDGAFEGERPAVAAPLPVRVHFTEEGVEADDRLLEYVDATAGARPVVVVSSDNRVRDGARHRGAGVVSSETLLALRR